MAETLIVATGVQPFPAAITLTGTIETTGTLVTGTGTFFTREIIFQGLTNDFKYPYLYSEDNAEVMEIVRVIDDTTMYIKAAFTADIAAGADLTVIDNYAAIVAIEFNPLGAGVTLGTLNKPAVAIDGNAIKIFENEAGITPIVVDATASDCEVVYS